MQISGRNFKKALTINLIDVIIKTSGVIPEETDYIM